jgi:uncharacterized repeat protein (TIGR04138 family)
MSDERAKLYAAAVADKRYAIEAYEFLCHALVFTQHQLDRVPEPGLQPENAKDKHVSGQELLEGIRQLALEQFGPLAFIVFRSWGLKSTRDFGNMVYHLIDSGIWFCSETDRIEDFDDLYDFEEAFLRDAPIEWDEL